MFSFINEQMDETIFLGLLSIITLEIFFESDQVRTFNVCAHEFV